jgi:hypothetical protein
MLIPGLTVLGKSNWKGLGSSDLILGAGVTVGMAVLAGSIAGNVSGELLTWALDFPFPFAFSFDLRFVFVFEGSGSSSDGSQLMLRWCHFSFSLVAASPSAFLFPLLSLAVVTSNLTTWVAGPGPAITDGRAAWLTGTVDFAVVTIIAATLAISTRPN